MREREGKVSYGQRRGYKYDTSRIEYTPLDATTKRIESKIKARKLIAKKILFQVGESTLS